MLIDDLFALSPAVRYVATVRDGRLESRQRPGLTNASSSESDRYEELIVNPALLTIVRLRGEIDCGGARWIMIRYGSFLQFVRPVLGGHVSIGWSASEDPLRWMSEITRILVAHGIGIGDDD